MVSDTLRASLFTLCFDEVGPVADQPIALLDFGYIWGLCTKALPGIKKGRRIENSLWRLWYEEMSPSSLPSMRKRQPKTLRELFDTLTRYLEDDFVESRVKAALDQPSKSSPRLAQVIQRSRLDLGRERDGGTTSSIVIKPKPNSPVMRKQLIPRADSSSSASSKTSTKSPAQSKKLPKTVVLPSQPLHQKTLLNNRTSSHPTITNLKRPVSPTVSRRPISPAMVKRSQSHSMGPKKRNSPPIGSKPARRMSHDRPQTTSKSIKPTLSRRSTAPQPLDTMALPYPGYVNPLRPLLPLSPPPLEPERRSQLIWGDQARRRPLNIPPPVRAVPLNVIKGFEIQPSSSQPQTSTTSISSTSKGKGKEVIAEEEETKKDELKSKEVDKTVHVFDRRGQSFSALGLKPMQPIKPLAPLNATSSNSSNSAVANRVKKSSSPLRTMSKPLSKLTTNIESDSEDVETTEAEDDDSDSLWSSEGDDEEMNSEEERKEVLRQEWAQHEEDKKTWFTKRPVSMVDVTRPSALTAIFHPSQVDEPVRMKAVFHRNKSERDLLTGLQASKSTTALDSRRGEISKAKGVFPARAALGGLSALRPMTAAKPDDQSQTQGGPSRLRGKPEGIELESDDESEESEDEESRERRMRYQVELERRDRERLETLMAPPLSPRTTKRQMLAGEFQATVWKDLLNERGARRGSGQYRSGNWAKAIKGPIFGQPEAPKALTLGLKSGATVGEVSKTEVLGTSVLPPGKDIRDIEDRLGPPPENQPDSGMANGRRKRLPQLEEKLRRFTEILKDRNVAPDIDQRREVAIRYLHRNDRRRKNADEDSYDEGLETQSEIGEEEETPWQERFGQSYHTSGW